MDKESFQFNFFKTSTQEPPTDDNDSKYNKNINSQATSSEWIIPADLFEKLKNSEMESELVDESIDLVKRKYSNILQDLKESSELSKMTEASDVVPNEYEGGLKTWECSIDLLRLLNEDEEGGEGVRVRVLEIGCGSGLPGIFCYKQFLKSCQDVTSDGLFVFQDFNQNVLETVTLPNILLNAAAETNLDNLKFIYGDWSGLASKLPEKSFDLILTSETIYRVESYEILLEIFSHSLKTSPEARVLLAAKDYYFGLGGSVNQFMNAAKSKGWNVKILKHFSEGVPRSILQLKRSFEN